MFRSKASHISLTVSGEQGGSLLEVSESPCGAASVCVCVLNFCTLASYGVDLVARQQLAVAEEWTSPRETEDWEGAERLLWLKVIHRSWFNLDILRGHVLYFKCIEV